MVSEADLNILVANVVSENSHSHCRLCLKETRMEFVRFDDCVSTDPAANCFSEILAGLLGEEVIDEIPGVDAVCMDCMQKLMFCHTFIEECKTSTRLLHKIFADLYDSLKVAIEPTDRGQQLYVVVGENESKVILMDPDRHGTSSHAKQKKVPQCRQYFCEECGTGGMDQTELKMHNTTVHGTFTCEICGQAFAVEMEFQSHCMNAHGFKCSQCNQHKDSKQSLIDHFLTMHQPCVCSKCGRTYKGLDKLRAHEQKHQSARNCCHKCGKNYVVKESFERHVQLCTEGLLEPHPHRDGATKTFFCDICGKGYSTCGGLRVHKRFVHGNAKPHECTYCGKQFTAPSYLRTHMVTHTREKNFPCDICNNKLVSKEALLYHKRRHTGEKPYSCKLCSSRFVNASARAEHMKFKHSGPTLTCHLCARKFFTKSFLRQHIEKHNDPASKLYMGDGADNSSLGNKELGIKTEIKSES